MKKEVGLWIDHRLAVIVTLLGEEPETKQVSSNIEEYVRNSGLGDDSGEDKRDGQDKRFEKRLSSYYDEVITHLHYADSILIMGPGEAKSELQRSLETHGFSNRIVGIETTDKMTSEQIVAKTRRHYTESRHGINRIHQ